MLIVVDGTWSVDFNTSDNGEDPSGRAIGNQDEGTGRSNSRRFFEESRYPANKKFYFVGPGNGMSGNDSFPIYFNVLRTIEREINNGNCDELHMVGWSRGAAIIGELTEGLEQLADTNTRTNPTRERVYNPYGGPSHVTVMRPMNNVLSRPMPKIKFVGLFDSVSMIWRSSPHNRRWGEEITDDVEYFAHVTAGDRTGPAGGLIDFAMRNPDIAAKRSVMHHIGDATHGGVGGDDTTAHAREAYTFIRNHATAAGCL